MNETFESKCRKIRKYYTSIMNKDSEVILTFKGNDSGVTKCFHIRIGDRESDNADYIIAADQLLAILKAELNSKISMLESQMKNYRQTLAI